MIKMELMVNISSTPAILEVVVCVCFCLEGLLLWFDKNWRDKFRLRGGHRYLVGVTPKTGKEGEEDAEIHWRVVVLSYVAPESFIRFSPFIEHYFHVVIGFRVTFTRVSMDDQWSGQGSPIDSSAHRFRPPPCVVHWLQHLFSSQLGVVGVDGWLRKTRAHGAGY